MLTLVQRAAVVVLALLVLVPPAEAAKKTATCKAGQVPKKATKKVVCTAFRLPKGAKPATAPRNAQGALAQLTDQLQTALTLVPGARARMDRKVGKKRAGKVVDLALEGWQRKAGIAAAGQSSTQSFGSAGAGGTAKLDVGAYDDGRTGWRVSAEAEVELTRSGLKGLGAEDQLPAGIEGGKAKVKLTFNDMLAACPSAAGTVAGRLEASGSLSVDIQTKSGPVSVDLSASAAMTYVVKVGDDGKWYEISDTDLKTKFSAGGSGQKTKSYYGFVHGDGYGTASILGAEGAAGTKAAIERDIGVGIKGGSSVVGPSGSWSTKDGGEKVDVLSLLDYKAMMASYVASQLINVAAIEYLRAVALPRGQKRWYDEEACLTADGSASPADKLKPSQTATVTVSGVKARDGGAVPGALTATGAASIAPGSASVAPGGSAAFTLTAPAASPSSATWQVVVISRGGKKTLSGAVPVKQDDLPMTYTGTIDGHVVYGGGLADQRYDGTLTFTRYLQDDFPDGSRNAWYKLTAASISLIDTQMGGPCGEYRYTGVGTDPVGGDIELLIAPDGTATAGYTADVSFGEVPHPGVGFKPKDCPGSFPPGLVKVVFNSRDGNGKLRPAGADLAIAMGSDTTDLQVNTAFGGAEFTTARWDLRPGY